MFPLTADGLDATIACLQAVAWIVAGALSVAFGMVLAEAQAAGRRQERRTGQCRRHLSPVVWPERRR